MGRSGFRRRRPVDDDAAYSHPSDAVLLMLVRRGDPDAYATLYERYRDDAHRFAASRLRSRTEAEDVVAEAFTATLAALDHGHGPLDSFRPYLFSTLRRECARLNKRRASTSPDLPSARAPHQVGHEPSGHRDPYARTDEALLVREAFESLPPQLRKVLWELEVDDLSPTQLSERYQSTPHAVAVLGARARRAFGAAYLAQHLASEAPGGALSAECRKVRPHLAASVRGAMSARRQRRIDDHLAGCRSCRDARDRLGQLNTHLRSLSLVPMALGLSDSGIPIGAAATSGLGGPMAAASGAASGGLTTAAAASWSGVVPLAASTVALVVAIGPAHDASPQAAADPSPAVASAPSAAAPDEPVVLIGGEGWRPTVERHATTTNPSEGSSGAASVTAPATTGPPPAPVTVPPPAGLLSTVTPSTQPSEAPTSPSAQPPAPTVTRRDPPGTATPAVGPARTGVPSFAAPVATAAPIVPSASPPAVAPAPTAPPLVRTPPTVTPPPPVAAPSPPAQDDDRDDDDRDEDGRDDDDRDEDGRDDDDRDDDDEGDDDGDDD